LTPGEADRLQTLRARSAAQTMNATLGDLFDIQVLNDPPPHKARILASRVCDGCGEKVMETRTRLLGNKCYCLPCFDKQANIA
jgi:formylmethanofuran dehydrogenase subunit E